LRPSVVRTAPLQPTRRQLFGDVLKNGKLFGLEFDDPGEQQPLYFDLPLPTLPQVSFEENSFMCCMLVNQPEALRVSGDDETLRTWPNG